MAIETPPRDVSTLRGRLSIVARQKWVILMAAAVVPLAAVLVSLRQEPLYRASAEVLLTRQGLPASVTGNADASGNQPADRVAATQAALARVPAVTTRVLETFGMGPERVDEFLERSTVSPRQNADLLEFQVTARSRVLAAELASEYARQFTQYRRRLDTGSLDRARGEVGRQIEDLESLRPRSRLLLKSLRKKDRELQTLQTLQTPNAVLVRSAHDAEQVQPRTIRNALVGLTLGALLGIAFAFVRDRLDTRLHSAEEIGELLGLPLLGRLPAPPKRVKKENQLGTVAAPDSVHAEAFRSLRTNLDLANLERSARAIMVTSAEEREGKSTTVANLAVTLAAVGRRVVVVDCDLRAPALAGLFGLAARPGVTEVALGQAELSAALVPLAIAEQPDGSMTLSRNRLHSRRIRGALEVLPAGRILPNPGELVGGGVIGEIIGKLREEADVVLIDSPPLLHVGDAVALSDKVDALMLVARMNVLRQPTVAELARILRQNPVTALGFALTGVEAGAAAGYFYGERRNRRRAGEAAIA